MTPAVSVNGLTVAYAGVRAVDGVSLAVDAGEVLGVMGPNGAGKTTLLNAMAGLVPQAKGDIVLSGRRIARLRPHRRVRRGLAVASQRPRTFPDLTVLQHLRVAARAASGASSEHDVTHVLERCALDAQRDQLPGELTPSELRRLELARAVATDPRVLLLDEVGAGLPDEELERVASVILSEAADGRAVVVVDHVLELVRAVCSRLLVMDLGRVISQGPPDVVMADPRVITAYLGVSEDGDTSDRH